MRDAAIEVDDVGFVSATWRGEICLPTGAWRNKALLQLCVLNSFLITRFQTRQGREWHVACVRPAMKDFHCAWC
jgi:hypothetical protein